MNLQCRCTVQCPPAGDFVFFPFREIIVELPAKVDDLMADFTLNTFVGKAMRLRIIHQCELPLRSRHFGTRSTAWVNATSMRRRARSITYFVAPEHFCTWAFHGCKEYRV